MSLVEKLDRRGAGRFPALIWLETTAADDAHLSSRLQLREELLAPNGYLHAATVIALADTSCGYGCFANLPEEAESFTTIELKSNFLGTAREGVITCEATLAHGGRTTQVWDATVADEAIGRTIALFRCTPLILYRR